MKFVFTDKKVTLPNFIHKYAEKKVGKLDRFFKEDATASFAPEEPEEGEYRIVRSKTFPIKPMSRDEAILQMNLLGHSFFAFKDEEAGGAFAVVYRRYDGDYGIIEDEQ